MDNQQYEGYARALAELYEAAELELIEITARRLERGIEQPGWAERKLAEVQQLRQQHQDALQRYLQGGELLLEVGVRLSYDAGAGPAYGSPIATRTKQEAIQALTQEAVNKLQTANTQILRSADDMYRAVIADTLRLSVSGVLTRKQATQRALESFVDGGYTAFIDKAGRRWDISSYAEMAARTGYMRAHLAGNLARYSQQGRDLVIVSVSPEPCPICDPYEGHVFSISGATTGYPHLQSAIDGGLFHANCTHRVTPFIPGLTRVVRPEEKYNRQGVNKYPERQQQRALERKIRKLKRKQAASIDPTAKALRGKKVRQAQAEMRGFISDTGRHRQRGREQLINAVRLRQETEARIARRAAHKPGADDILSLADPPRGRPARDLKLWAEHKYPGTEFDIEGLDDRAAADVVEQIHSLAQDWPLAMAQIKYIGTQGPNSSYPFNWDKEGASTFAQMHYRNEYMGLNPSFFGPGRYEGTLDRLQRAVDTNWTTGGNIREHQIKATIIHEFGHAIDNWLRTSKGMVLPYLRAGEGITPQYIMRRWHSKYEDTGTAASLSKYAVVRNSRRAESWAESFVLQHFQKPGKRPGKYQQAQKKLLELLHHSRWQQENTTPGSFISIGDLPEDEQDKAVEQINKLFEYLGL